jgi:hypothetical protein
MKKVNLLIIIIAVIILLIFLVLGFYYLNNSGPIKEIAMCKPLDLLDNSNDTKVILSCMLNNEKSIFKSEHDVSKVLSGACNITQLKDRYVDNKFNQVVNKPCQNCHLQGAEVWFDCEGYSSQFGCYFTVYQNKSFGDIYCPVGV